MPRGANPKREREYQELEEELEREGRHEGREEEAAARIVNKQRARYGEIKAAKSSERHSDAPDRGLPIARFEHLTVPEATRRLDGLTHQQLRAIEQHERSNKNRKSLLAQIERRIRH
jgi:hypothetical protein